MGSFIIGYPQIDEHGYNVSDWLIRQVYYCRKLIITVYTIRLTPSQSVVSSLDMRRRAGLFARRSVLLGRDDQLIRLPEVAVTMTLTIESRNALPQFLTTGLTAVANVIGDHLSGRTT